MIQKPSIQSIPNDNASWPSDSEAIIHITAKLNQNKKIKEKGTLWKRVTKIRKISWKH